MSKTPGASPENLDGSGLRIGVVQARFNPEITDALWQACRATLVECGVDADDILHLTVPGALEIPVVLQRLASTGDFDALVALGAIIKGGTYHFELVCNESAAGVTRVGLEYGIPIANAVLTTYTDSQARDRMHDKGSEAARVAVELANLMMDLDEQWPQAGNEGDEGDDD